MGNEYFSEPPTLHFWNNPEFNEVLIFYHLEAISFRDRKRIREFRDKLKSKFCQIKCENWPYTKRVMIVVEINGLTKMYSRKDVDNMSKAILDAGNKIIYDDNRLIDILVVKKKLWNSNLYWFHIGIANSELDEKYFSKVCFASKHKGDVPENAVAPWVFSFESTTDGEYVIGDIGK
jgi:Holliday junction resolvase RusA-like endonuclease